MNLAAATPGNTLVANTNFTILQRIFSPFKCSVGNSLKSQILIHLIALLHSLTPFVVISFK